MWSWHLAQPTVRPMKAVETVSAATMGSSFASLPSRKTAPRARNPRANWSSGRGSTRERTPVADICVRVEDR